MTQSHFKKLYIWKKIVVLAKAKLAKLKYDMVSRRGKNDNNLFGMKLRAEH